MHLIAETTAILDQIEALSGRPVRFMEQHDLPVLSAMQVARDGTSFHVLRYRPSDEPHDYRIAFQAAYTLACSSGPPGSASTSCHCPTPAPRHANWWPPACR